MPIEVGIWRMDGKPKPIEFGDMGRGRNAGRLAPPAQIRT